MTAFLDIVHVTKFHGGRAALDDVSLAVDAGRFVALVGPSGSGKTTLLKSINRLIEPDTGTIAVDGRDVRDRPVAELRHGIGYVIQTIGLFPHMTVAENIDIVPKLTGADGQGGRVARAGRATARFCGPLPARTLRRAAAAGRRRPRARRAGRS